MSSSEFPTIFSSLLILLVVIFTHSVNRNLLFRRYRVHLNQRAWLNFHSTVFSFFRPLLYLLGRNSEILIHLFLIHYASFPITILVTSLSRN